MSVVLRGIHEFMEIAESQEEVEERGSKMSSKDQKLVSRKSK